MFNRESLTQKLGEVLQALDAWGAQVLFYDAVDHSLKVVAGVGVPEDWNQIVYDAEDSMNGEVIRENSPLLINEISADSLAGEVTKHEVSALLIAPIARNGEVLGTIQVLQGMDGRDFTKDDVALLEARTVYFAKDFEGEFEGFRYKEQVNPGNTD